MDLVSMSLLYGLILAVALVLVLWKSIRGRSSKQAPLETDDGLTLKALVGDGTKNPVRKPAVPRQPIRSWTPKPIAAAPPKPKVVEIAAPVSTKQIAAPINSAPISEPVKAEKAEQSAASFSVDDNPLPSRKALAEETAAEETAIVEETLPAISADNGSSQIESPIQEPSEVKQFAAPLFIEDAGAQPIESPAQEESVEIEETPAQVLPEDSMMQPSESKPRGPTTSEDIASAVAPTRAAEPSEPEVQQADAAEDVSPVVAAEHTVTSASQPEIQEAVRKESYSFFSDSSAAEEPIAKTFLSFYGLSEQPFGVTPDPAYLYLSQAHQEASGALSEGIRNLRGFMALIADSGMGKTTLLNKLMEDLQDLARVVFLFQTQCNSRELLRYILGELGVPHAGLDLVAMHRALNEFLFQGLLEGKRFVLVVDEAQNLQDSTLETIRLLSDFETTHTKLLQIVLAGQPQLADKLMRPNLSQLRQRIAVVANLEPLGAAETVRYVEHRLRVAGSSEPIFTAEALALIAERSQGIPRNINNICCNALQLGYAQQRQTIDIDIVQKVAGKLDLESLVLKRPEQPKATADPVPVAPANKPQQRPSAAENQPAQWPVPDAQRKINGALTGKLTELARSRPWSKDQEFKLQLLLEREPSSELSVADRYYSCSFYVSEEQATAFRLGQPIRIKFEQD